MKKTLKNYLGLLGVVALLSYTVAVIFAPAAYPNYDWMAQAISDLSAENAPSRALWDQLASLYGSFSIVSVTMVCVFIQNKLNQSIRTGIYLFGMMMVGSIGTMIVPQAYFGIVERISMFSVPIFNAILGTYLFQGF